MAIIARSVSTGTLYMKFRFDGKQVLKSCHTLDVKLAKKREIAELDRLKLEKHSPTPKELPTAPMFKEYARLPDPAQPDDPGGVIWVSLTKQHCQKPRTLEYYHQRITSLLSFAPIANAPLGDIKVGLLKRYEDEMKANRWKTSTMKKNMGVIHLVLDRAQGEELVGVLPKFPKYGKPKRIGVAISPEQELVYMATVDQDHKDYCSIMINTGMEPGPTADLVWSDVHFGSVGKYTRGYIYDRCEKTETRARDLPMTSLLANVMKERWLKMGRPSSGPVFPADRNGKFHSTPLSSFQSVHKRLWIKSATRTPLAMKRFRLYDFRHTALTRAVESGMSAFELQQMAGWSSIRMAEEYIHLNATHRAKAADRFSDYLDEQEAKRTKVAGVGR